MVESNLSSEGRNSEASVSAARQRLALAKIQESTYLNIVKSQKEMLKMMKKNMVVAQSQLKISQRAVRQAEQLVIVEEKRRAKMIDCKQNDLDDIYDNSPTQVQFHPSITRSQESTLHLPPIYQDQRQSLSLSLSSLSLNQVSKPTPEPRLKSQLLNLRPEAKMVLREVVMSAILHPRGKVNLNMLENAVKKSGMSKQVIMNAVQVAQIRLSRKQMTKLAQAQRATHTGRTSESTLGKGI